MSNNSRNLRATDATILKKKNLVQSFSKSSKNCPVKIKRDSVCHVATSRLDDTLLSRIPLYVSGGLQVGGFLTLPGKSVHIKIITFITIRPATQQIFRRNCRKPDSLPKLPLTCLHSFLLCRKILVSSQSLKHLVFGFRVVILCKLSLKKAYVGTK